MKEKCQGENEAVKAANRKAADSGSSSPQSVNKFKDPLAKCANGEMCSCNISVKQQSVCTRMVIIKADSSSSNESISSDSGSEENLKSSRKVAQKCHNGKINFTKRSTCQTSELPPFEQYLRELHSLHSKAIRALNKSFINKFCVS